MGTRVLTLDRIIHGRDIYQVEEIEEPDSPSKMKKKIRRAKKEMRDPGGNFNRRLTGVCHLTSEIAP